MSIFSRFFGGAKKIVTGESFTSFYSGDVPSKHGRALLGEYRNLVYSCIRAITDEVGRYEPKIYKRSDEGNKVPLKGVHPMLKILDNPNPTMTKFEFFAASETYLELTGEFFWYKAKGQLSGKTKELYLLSPDKMKVAIDDKTGDVKGYAFMKGNGTEIPLLKEEIIHKKEFDPSNPYRGLGVVQAGLLFIETDNKTGQFQHNFMKNQATPSGILTLKSTKGLIGVEAFKKIMYKWKEEYSGTDNAGKTLVIREADADFKKLGLSLSELDMGALKRLTQENVRQLFRVPQQLLGITETGGLGGLGRANIEAIEYMFAKKTIEPKLDSYDDLLTRWLKDEWKDEELFVEHVSQIPEDKEFKLKEYDIGVDRWILRDEIRQETGRESIVGTDELYTTFNQIPIGESNPKLSESKAATLAPKIVSKAASRNFFDALLTVEDRLANTVENRFIKYLNKQERYVLGKLGEQMGKSLVVFPESEEELLKLTGLLEALVTKVMMQVGEMTLEYLGSDAEFALTQAIRDVVFDNLKKGLKDFDLETAKKIQKQLAIGLSEAEDVAQLTKRIEAVYEEAAGYRAERIARTESHRIVNEANARAYLQQGVTKVKWVARGNACPFCKAMDGRVVNIGQSFVPVGGSITADDGSQLFNNFIDIKYADAHPNCNCYLDPVFEKSVEVDIAKSSEDEVLNQKLLKLINESY